MIRRLCVAYASDEMCFIHIRRDAIRDDETDISLLQELHRGCTVLGGHNLVPVLLYNLLDDHAFVQVSVEDKDLHTEAASFVDYIVPCHTCTCMPVQVLRAR